VNSRNGVSGSFGEPAVICLRDMGENPMLRLYVGKGINVSTGEIPRHEQHNLKAHH
jgi:hypothetical protein